MDNFKSPSTLENISQNVNICSSPSELKITDIRVCNINGAPKHCPLIKIYTNQGLVGYGEVRDASSATKSHHHYLAGKVPSQNK